MYHNYVLYFFSVSFFFLFPINTKISQDYTNLINIRITTLYKYNKSLNSDNRCNLIYFLYKMYAIDRKKVNDVKALIIDN